MNKKYGLILADPPWSYSNSGTRGAAKKQYDTMSIDDICSMPIEQLSADNSVLLLWGTWPLLPEALRVISAWGFEYVTGLPWIKITSCQNNLFGDVQLKVPYGVGFWARGCSEPIFIARKGNVSPPNSGYVGLLSPNYYHSRKPDSIYEIAESLDGPYLELFARRSRPGWNVFGNEVDGSIQIEGMAA